VQVSEAEVQQFYRTQIARNNPNALYYTPATAQIRIILTTNEAEGHKAVQSLESGVPFEQVAYQYSRDLSRSHGGLMPPVQRGRSRAAKVPGLEDAIFSLKIGEQFGPRRFGKVWWIVRCVDKFNERTAPFTEVADACHTGALLVRATKLNGPRVAAEFDDFKRHALIQAFDPNYASIANNR
jgi:parvulin-like peptidyl-prolyl isomerase